MPMIVWVCFIPGILCSFHTVNYCEACLTVTSCLGHGVFWAHTLTHIDKNECTSCSISPDLALDSKSEEHYQCISVYVFDIIYWACACTVRGKRTTAIKPQVTTNCVYFYWHWKVMFVDVKLYTCDCPEMTQIASPAVCKALGLLALLLTCLTSSLPWRAPYWKERE